MIEIIFFFKEIFDVALIGSSITAGKISNLRIRERICIYKRVEQITFVGGRETYESQPFFVFNHDVGIECNPRYLKLLLPETALYNFSASFTKVRADTYGACGYVLQFFCMPFYPA